MAGSSGAHLSTQATREAEIRRIKVLGQPGQKKVNETPSQQGEKLGLVVCIFVLPLMAGSI
jgi:hypothetical protein